MYQTMIVKHYFLMEVKVMGQGHVLNAGVFWQCLAQDTCMCMPSMNTNNNKQSYCADRQTDGET